MDPKTERVGRSRWLPAAWLGSVTIIVCILLLLSCGKEEVRYPPMLPPGVNSVGQKSVTLHYDLPDWRFFPPSDPYTGPGNGDDSVFVSGDIDLEGTGYTGKASSLVQIKAIYLSDPSGVRFAVKKFSDTAAPVLYTYSIREGFYEGPYLSFRFTQLVPGTRPLADSAHVEISW